MTATEIPVVFRCAAETLVGVATVPEAPRPLGVVIIVGGPQYRAGSHRQFTLLARALAERGYASLRFDYRGIGDSSGDVRSFDSIDDDVEAAVLALRERVPQAHQVVLWGLCDAASAALLMVGRLEGIAGLVLANPWVRYEGSQNEAIVRHYYRAHVLSRAFWSKLLSGRMRIGGALRELLGRLQAAHRNNSPANRRTTDHFIDRMLTGWQSFQGKRLVILSGRDLTAREFEDLASRDSRWSWTAPPANTLVHRIPAADHTFSTAEDRADVAEATSTFLNEVCASAAIVDRDRGKHGPPVSLRP